MCITIFAHRVLMYGNGRFGLFSLEPAFVSFFKEQSHTGIVILCLQIKLPCLKVCVFNFPFLLFYYILKFFPFFWFCMKGRFKRFDSHLVSYLFHLALDF